MRRSKLQAHPRHKLDQRGLGGAVSHLPWNLRDAGHGRHKDHGSASGVGNRLSSDLHGEERMGEHKIELRCPELIIKISQRSKVRHAHNVDRSPDRAGLLVRFGEYPLNVVPASNVA